MKLWRTINWAHLLYKLFIKLISFFCLILKKYIVNCVYNEFALMNENTTENAFNAECKHPFAITLTYVYVCACASLYVCEAIQSHNHQCKVEETTNIFRMHAQFKINCQIQKNAGKMMMTSRGVGRGQGAGSYATHTRIHAVSVCVGECPGCALKYACRKLKLIIYIFKAGRKRAEQETRRRSTRINKTKNNT